MSSQRPSVPSSRSRSTGLRLLLSRGDSDCPEVVLQKGLPLSLLDGAPAPSVAPNLPGVQAFGDASRDASVLSERRWGVVVPENERLRAALLGAIDPLLALRAEQQGIDKAGLLGSLVYGAPSDPDLPLAKAVDWYRRAICEEDLADVYRKTELERPDYLLVLGDLHHVPEAIVQVLASYGHFVGRLAFTDETGQPRLADYRQYAEKVVAAPDSTATMASDDDDDAAAEGGEGSGGLLRRARLLYVRDGSDATEMAQELLIAPLLSRLALPQRKGRPADLNPATAAALLRSDDLLQTASQLPASLLFTVSHGYGGPRAGFPSPVEQRRQQGALSFPSPSLHSPSPSRRLSAADLRAARVPFVAGGVWFMLACYGAGTPGESQFYPWLAGRGSQLDDEARWVLRSLPAPSQRVADSRPFVAALPQAALAQPDGPLAIIGHLDLAWSYSFVDGGEGDSSPSDNELSRGDSDHFETFVRSLMRRTRVGAAFASLSRKQRRAEQSLLRRYDAQRRAQLTKSDRATAAGGPSAATDAVGAGFSGPGPDAVLRRHWMTRQDLVGYVVLGDPAVRLPAASSSRPRALPVASLSPTSQGDAAPSVVGSAEPVKSSAAVSAAPPVTASPAVTVAAPAQAVNAVPPVAQTLTAPTMQAMPMKLANLATPINLAMPSIDLRRLEDAIVLRSLQPDAAAAVANSLGLSDAELDALQATYHQAGRAALLPPHRGPR